MSKLDDLTCAYLAGYLERGGAIRLYINWQRDGPLLKTTMGEVRPIESTGIYVRVRAAADPSVLRLLKGNFGGSLTPGEWQTWNQDAKELLQAILPYLRTGRRRALVQLLLDFYSFIEECRERDLGKLSLGLDDIEIILRYENALREITGR